MPRQLQGSWPATERRYVPEAHGSPGYQERQQLVSLVRVLERRPDVHLRVFVRGIPLEHPIVIPARDEEAFLARLFRDPPLPDRTAIGELADALIDETLRAVTAELGETVVGIRDYEPVMLAKRRVCAAYETMAADVHALSGLPDDQRGAA